MPTVCIQVESAPFMKMHGHHLSTRFLPVSFFLVCHKGEWLPSVNPQNPLRHTLRKSTRK
jgi:hypothetical protein